MYGFVRCEVEGAGHPRNPRGVFRHGMTNVFWVIENNEDTGASCLRLNVLYE